MTAYPSKGKGWSLAKKAPPSTVLGTEALSRLLTEAEFTHMVVDLAQTCGWLVYHPRPARTQTGWVTAMSGDKGFPDIVAIKGKREVVAELKSEYVKTPTDEQWEWLWAFREAGAEVFVWRPSDWSDIVQVFGEGRIS